MKKIVFFVLIVTTMNLVNAQPASFKSPPEWSKAANIYEVNIRQYTPEGTIDAFAKHISRLDNMGVDILWVMPVQPIGLKNRKGSLGSYYSIQNYTAVNPEFGSMKDFKKMVSAAHKAGMYVIVDWVANHTAWDNPWITEHPDWYTKGKDGFIISPVADWADVADLNFDNADMRKAMIEAMRYWITEADVDGFRCDVAYMVPNDFWKTAVEELQKTKPNLFMLAEAEGPEFHENGFDMDYTWQVHHAMNDLTKEKVTLGHIDSIIQTQRLAYPADSYRMYFTSNHDENSWQGTEFERMGNGAEAMFVLAATIPGMPLIYSGQEAGLNKRLRFFDKDTIGFGIENKYESFYKTLLELKHDNSALWNGSYGGSFDVINTENEVYVFTRQKGKDKVLVVINCSNESRAIALNNDLLKGKYTNAFTGEKIKLKSKSSFNLDPFGYQVWEQ